MGKKHKEPLRLKEDTLEVGLERYRKGDRNRNSWFVVNAPWIAIGALVLVAIGPLWLMRGFFSPMPDAAAPVARLTVGAPTLVWVEGSSSQLQSVRVSVANSGAVHASGVKIVARIRGRNFVLAGPDTIDSGDGEVFSGITDTVYRSGDAIDVTASCSNCR
jgi:hypothetical protein